MVLRRLELTGFGRFADRAFELQTGLNILFGPNEAGKSTLAAFLDGILFGFRRTRTQTGRARRNRAYSPERDRYRPWDGGAYAGALEYEHEGRRFLVARDFAGDTLAVRDALTGADVGEEFEADPLTGERDFARRHGGLTPLVYRNTVRVRHVGLAMERGAFADEIRQALSRAMGTEDVAAARAADALSAACEHVGGERRGGTPLGQAARAVADLQDRREQAAAVLDLTRRLEEAQAALAVARAAEGQRRAEYEALQRRRRAAARHQIAELEAERGRDAEWAEFPAHRETELAAREADVVRARAAREREAKALPPLRERVAEAESALAALGRAASLTPERVERARGAWRAALVLLEQGQAARAAAEHRARRLEELTRVDDDAVARARRLRRAAVPLAAAAAVAAVGAAGGVLGYLGMIAVPRLPLEAAGAAVLLAGLAMGLRTIWARRSLVRVCAAAGATDLAALEALAAERADLLGRTPPDPAADFRRAEAEEQPARVVLEAAGRDPAAMVGGEPFWAELAAQAAAVVRARGESEEARRALQGRKEAEARAAAEEGDAERRLTAFLAETGAPSAEAFRDAASAARRYAEASARLSELRALVGPEPPGGPDEAPAVKGEGATEADERLAYDAWQTALAEAGAAAEREADLRARLGPDRPDLAAVEGELALAEERRRGLTRRQRALQLAQDLLRQLAEEVQREFAPLLHQRLTELVPVLTDGRYREVLMDEELRVTVRVPGRADLAPVEDLSRGTADQVLLAARVALAEAATGDARPPLVLDDSLVHFDDGRLGPGLRTLAQLASDRQVLLFTCQMRVLEAAVAEGVPHHLVQVGG